MPSPAVSVNHDHAARKHRFLGGQGSALGPPGFKVIVAQRIPQRRNRSIVVGIVDLERTPPVRCRMATVAPNSRAASR